jgi:O-acetyl-ADP-ribose deacetylase
MPDIVGTMTLGNGGVFQVVIGDLLAEPVDAIINAANGGLSHGGGVAAAISAAAGPALDEEGARWVHEHGRIPVGGAVVTTAGRLPFRGVIHAVGPQMGIGNEEEVLVRALTTSFALAHDCGWASVSFPAVSSGIFAVPPTVCAKAYIQAVRAFATAHPQTTLLTLRLCLFTGPLVDLVLLAMGCPRGAAK